MARGVPDVSDRVSSAEAVSSGACLAGLSLTESARGSLTPFADTFAREHQRPLTDRTACA